MQTALLTRAHGQRKHGGDYWRLPTMPVDRGGRCLPLIKQRYANYAVLTEPRWRACPCVYARRI